MAAAVPSVEKGRTRRYLECGSRLSQAPQTAAYRRQMGPGQIRQDLRNHQPRQRGSTRADRRRRQGRYRRGRQSRAQSLRRGPVVHHGTASARARDVQNRRPHRAARRRTRRARNSRQRQAAYLLAGLRRSGAPPRPSAIMRAGSPSSTARPIPPTRPSSTTPCASRSASAARSSRGISRS